MADPIYFDRWFNAVLLRDLSREGVGFRPAQLGAFWAVCSHFTLNDEAAIVSMPTGSGKTAVMNIVPFGLHARRVLVITPSVLVRDQVAEQFSDFALLRSIEAVKPGTRTPKVMRATKQLASKSSWENCLEYDVVVGTPNCVSPAYQDVGKAFRRVKTEIFDLILIDEGHHSPARTWRILIESFPNARKVLFTATPFRRDKLEIPGSLVYSYSLAKALKDGVYCPIEFVGVSLPDPKHKHQLLIEEAKRVVKNERKAGRDSKLVIRTDHIRSAEKLQRLYKRNGLTIGLVHSNRSLGHNREIIRQLRAGDLDGIICIGMLGEGFDLPELKIAVYHEPHESFPATLQFIGRVVRTAKNQYPKAFVVARFADAQGETRRLYDSDSDWTFLIPQMAHAAIEEERDVRQKLQQFNQERGDTVLSLRSLNPYFSVRIFRVAPSSINLAARPAIENVVVRDNWWHDTLNCAATVTERAQRPLWTKTIGFVESIHDLHLFYYDTRSHLLFVHSTFEAIADDLLERLAPGVRKQLSAEEINRVLHVANSTVDYIQIGLRNIANVGPGAAAYKTLAGMGVQAAVNPADARAFTTGHLFGRVTGENRAELVGLSIAGSKVWSAQRGHLIAFVKWCRALAEQIHVASTDGSTVPPHLELLPVPQRVLVLGGQALSAVWDRICFEGTVDIIKQHASSSKRMCSIFDADLRVLSVNDSPSRLELTVEKTDPDVRLSAFFSCSDTPAFQDRRSIDFRIAVDDGSSPRRIYSLAEFFTLYPPTIYMSDGTVFIGQDLYEPKIQFPLVAESCFVSVDWTGVNITREVGNAGRGRQNVQDFIEDYILRVFPRTSFLVKDHGSGEIADFIVINGNDSHLHLFHCKGSGAKRPGLRIDDMYEVVGQAVKSLQWCRRAELFDEVLGRVASKPSKLIRGTAASLRNLLEKSSPAGTQYTIHLVQPGLDLGRVVAGSAINSLLVNCYSWLSSTGAGVSLKVMGS